MDYVDLNKANALGAGQITGLNGLNDAEFRDQLMRYRRSVAGSYRALMLDELLTALPPGKLSVSPKIDGELWFLILDEGDAVLTNPRGRLIVGDIPVLTEAAKIAVNCTERTVIAGELFVAKKEGRPRVGDVASLLAQRENASVEKMGFAAFDLISGGDSQASMPIPDYASRLATLQRLCKGGKRLKSVKTEIISTPQRAVELFTEWVDGGKAEGLIVRSNDDRVYKIKPSITIDAAIIGYTERRDDPKQVRSLLFALMREDETFQVLGASGNLGDDAMRERLMTMLAPHQISSNYRQVSGSGALYRFVKPKTVAEIKVTDLQSQDSSGDAIDRMVLQLSDDGWSSIRQMSGVALLHPRMVRLRDDKDVNSRDIRVEQVSEFCFIPDVSTKAEAQTLPSSEILRREVYTKITKGVTAVRKLVLWKTNKDDVDPAYPSFVIHWTDYSPGRKSPLKHEVKTAGKHAVATQIADTLITTNIKKGWEPAEVRGEAENAPVIERGDSPNATDPIPLKKETAEKKTAKKKTAKKKTAKKKTAKKKTAKKKTAKKKTAKK